MKLLILLWTLFCLYGAIFGGAAVDLSNFSDNVSPKLESSLGVAMWVVLWLIVALLIHIFENILRSTNEESGDE